MQHLLGDIRRADEQYRLIAHNAHVAVGLSGGKDSLALLYALSAYRAIKPFSLTALTVVPDEHMNILPLKRLCQSLNVPYFYEHSSLFDTLFDGATKSPCAKCSRVRRGTLCAMAARQGCDALALGHHMDDALETLLMAVLKEGRFHTMKPKSLMARTGVTLIRPLILTDEKRLRALCEKKGLTPIKNPCPIDCQTTRQEMKMLLANAQRTYPDVKDKLTGAIKKANFFIDHD